MPDTLSYIKELIIFYIKTNYEDYLKKNNLQKIPEDKIESIIELLYTGNKEHLKSSRV